MNGRLRRRAGNPRVYAIRPRVYSCSPVSRMRRTGRVTTTSRASERGRRARARCASPARGDHCCARYGSQCLDPWRHTRWATYPPCYRDGVDPSDQAKTGAAAPAPGGCAPPRLRTLPGRRLEGISAAWCPPSRRRGARAAGGRSPRGLGRRPSLGSSLGQREMPLARVYSLARRFLRLADHRHACGTHARL